MGAAATLRLHASAALGRWAHRRQGDDTLPLTLRPRRIYILPTRAGLAFAVLLLAMLVAGLNYSNSLTLLLTFVLAGTSLIGIHECQRTLKGLQLLAAEAEDAFAGQAGRIELRFANPASQARSSLTVRGAAPAQSRFELPPASRCVHAVEYPALRRGRLRPGRIEISTTAPHGLFRAWSWLHLPLEAVVYPQPRGTLPLPAGGESHALYSARSRHGHGDEWAALRPFTPGDSPRAVAWKLYAREAPLLVSQYASQSGADRVLDFAQLHGLDVEARLSQLCAWILECARRGEAYALHLPAQAIPGGRGPEHQRRCLRALALFGDPASGQRP